jgi:hypothetical protein
MVVRGEKHGGGVLVLRIVVSSGARTPSIPCAMGLANQPKDYNKIAYIPIANQRGKKMLRKRI